MTVSVSASVSESASGRVSGCECRVRSGCACLKICTSRFTKCCACHDLHFEVHHALCLPRNLHLEVRQVLHLPRNLHIEAHRQSAAPATKSALRGSPSAVPTKSLPRGSLSAVSATKSANEPHVQKSRFTAPVTKSELLDDHHHVQSAAPATKTAFRSKTAPIPCTCHEKSTLEHQNTRFSLRLPRKVTTMYQNAHGTTTRESAVARSTRRGHPDSASLRSRNAHGRCREA